SNEDGDTVYPPDSDEAGDKVPEDVLENTVFFNATVDSVGLIQDFPEISEDGKEITFTYSKPFADWQVNLSHGVPAHVVASHALGIDDPEEATQRSSTRSRTTAPKRLRRSRGSGKPDSSLAESCPMTRSCSCPAGPTCPR